MRQTASCSWLNCPYNKHKSNTGDKILENIKIMKYNKGNEVAKSGFQNLDFH